MRAIDKANKNAKKPEGIGFHSHKKYFKLNPNRKPEMKGGIKKALAKAKK